MTSRGLQSRESPGGWEGTHLGWSHFSGLSKGWEGWEKREDGFMIYLRDELTQPGDQSDGDYDERGLLVWLQLLTTRRMMLFHQAGSSGGGQQQGVAGRHFAGMRCRLSMWTMRWIFRVTPRWVHRMYQREYVKSSTWVFYKDEHSVLEETGCLSLCPGNDVEARPYPVSG